jgi:hypothetical protein
MLSPSMFKKEDDDYYIAGVNYGKNEGAIDGKMEVALEMKSRGFDLQLISKVTKLPLANIVGTYNGRIKIAIEMKNIGIDLQVIADVTKLPLQEIQTL